jgi:transposase InsO family protein
MTKLRDKNLVNLLRKKYSIGWTHAHVQQFLRTDWNITVSKRTLKRWKKQLCNPNWYGPAIPCVSAARRLTSEMSKEICSLRLQTGWGSFALKECLRIDLSESTYKRIIKTCGLSRGSPIEDKRIHWVKWQRLHADSLWQIDSFQLSDGSWITCVIDDCSRYCLGMHHNTRLSTKAVIQLLESIMERYGCPREILTDNGAEHGLTSKLSKFDKWCQSKGIKHIRSRVHKPTTTGKVERFQQTVRREMPFCNHDLELFRYRYNCIRPHMSLHGQVPADVYFSIEQRLKESESKPQTWWE